jgi:anti-anti-sigma factor
MDVLVPTILSAQAETWKGIPVLVVSGEIDMSTAPRLGEAIEKAMVPGVPLVVSLAAVQFIDSAGTHVLALADRTASAQGGRLMIVPSVFVARVLEVSGLDSVFELHGELNDALGAALAADR